MLWISALLVLGAAGTFVVALGPSPERPLIKDQIIHARVPWGVLGTIWVGVAIGVGAMVHRRSLLRWISFAPLVAVALFASYFLLQMGNLPESTLRIAVGDPFPGFALPNQDEVVLTRAAGAPRPPELYIFYRGDW